MTKKTKPQKRNKSLTLLQQSKTLYPTSPDKAKLEAFDNAYRNRDYSITFDCPEFTALCPVTGQPDFGHIVIQYIPDKLCLESKSIKLYMFSFRNHGTFHEESVNRILDEIVRAIKPRSIPVTGDFNIRGGIAISVEASHGKR